MIVRASYAFVAVTCLAAIFCHVTSYAQDVPRVLQYDGRLLVDGSPARGTYDVTFSLFTDAEGGQAVWSEDHEVTPDDGLFSVLLGSINPLPPSVPADHNSLYLSMRIAGDQEMAPRLFMASTMYTMRAGLADIVRNGSIDTDALADAAVSSAKLADNSVTDTKLADGAVTGEKVADGAITPENLAPDAAVTSLNSLAEDVIIAAGDGIEVNTAGNTITISDAGVFSSRRWKTNIQTLDDPLGLVERLRGVSYEWKEDGRSDIGLVAEEVGAVIPEIVEFEANGTDARTVNYGKLVSVLIEAVKTQQQQLDARDDLIEDMMARLERLEQLSLSSTSTSDAGRLAEPAR